MSDCSKNFHEESPSSQSILESTLEFKNKTFCQWNKMKKNKAKKLLS